MNRLNAVVMLLVTLLSLGGCKKDNTIVDPGFTNTAGQVVYVVNEGNFNKGNATLTMYLPDSLKAYQDVFYLANGSNLGDIANDMAVKDSVGFIVVNNSQKIEVVSLATMKSLGTITIPGFKSPYKAVIFSTTKGYVTNLYDNSVTVFNPTTFAIVKERIPVGLNPQGIIVCNGKIYVCNSGYGADSTVSVIDPFTDTVVKTIVVGKSPSEIGIDGQSKLIVKCDGVTSYPDPAKESAGSIVKIDPTTDSAAASLPLPLATYDHPAKMAVSDAGMAYVKVRSGIIKIETSSMTVSDPAFIPLASFSINGMAFDNVAHRLYVADAVDYVSAGSVMVYELNGSSAGTFKAGIIPGKIAFKLAH